MLWCPNNNKVHLISCLSIPISSSKSFLIMSLFAVFSHAFGLLPFCLIVSLCSLFMCFGGCIVFDMLVSVFVFVTISIISASISLECVCLCIWANQYQFIKYIFCLWSDGFWHLIYEVVLSGYWDGFHMPFLSFWLCIQSLSLPGLIGVNLIWLYGIEFLVYLYIAQNFVCIFWASAHLSHSGTWSLMTAPVSLITVSSWIIS